MAWKHLATQKGVGEVCTITWRRPGRVTGTLCTLCELLNWLFAHGRLRKQLSSCFAKKTCPLKETTKPKERWRKGREEEEELSRHLKFAIAPHLLWKLDLVECLFLKQKATSWQCFWNPDLCHVLCHVTDISGKFGRCSLSSHRQIHTCQPSHQAAQCPTFAAFPGWEPIHIFRGVSLFCDYGEGQDAGLGLLYVLIFDTESWP